VDWINQAFLYLRVGNGNGRSSKTDQATTDESGDRKLLRRYGIRTATDPLNAFDKAGTKDERFRQRAASAAQPRSGTEDHERDGTSQPDTGR
jgi:hypothetical protein